MPVRARSLKHQTHGQNGPMTRYMQSSPSNMALSESPLPLGAPATVMVTSRLPNYISKQRGHHALVAPQRRLTTSLLSAKCPWLPLVYASNCPDWTLLPKDRHYLPKRSPPARTAHGPFPGHVSSSFIHVASSHIHHASSSSLTTLLFSSLSFSHRRWMQ